MSSNESAERWRRIEAIFTAAIDREPEARASFVAMACDGDQALYEEVSSLLAAHERTGLVEKLAEEIFPLAAELRAAVPALNGRTLGAYAVKGRIGGGGMGVVHEAYDQRLDRTVALKFLQPHLSSDSVAADRFRLEARTVAALEHPNICTVHEIGETDDGLLYLVMPLYDGETVQQRLARGPLPLEQAISIAIHVLRALAKAHARGIIHRDIKPSNVLITSDSVVKLLDFGIAKLADVALTGTSAGPIGTAAYMSPEQAIGTSVDARTDVWSVGVMLFEMITGQRPYASGAAAAMTGELRRPAPISMPSLRADVTPELEQVVLRAVERAADERYQSATEFEQALTALGLAAVSSDGIGRGHAPRSAIGAAPSPPSWRRRAPLVVIVLLLAVLGGAAWVASYRTSTSVPAWGVGAGSTDPAVAVLPFIDRSEKGDQEFFADGITEELISTLSRVEGLRVASSTSVFAHRDRTEDVPALGARLGVSTVVEGNLRRSGEQLRITARLVNVADGLQLWSQSFDRKAGDAFAVQREIAQAIATALQRKLVLGTRVSDAGNTPDAAAYESYLRGRHALYLKGRYAWSSRTEQGVRSALQFFEQAVRQDSTFAPALAGVADAYAVLGFYDYLPPTEAFPRAEAAAARAIALDSTLGAPHATLGYVALYYHWDLKRGEAAFRRAIALEPDYATAHQWYGNLLVAAGRFPEAVREMQRAEQLDPLSLIARSADGWVRYHAGDYQGALAKFAEALELNPDYGVALLWRGWTLQAMDSLPAAISAHRRAVALSDSGALNIASLARTLAVANARPEAERLLSGLMERDARGQYVPSYEIAKIFSALGLHADAFIWLEKARQQRSHSLIFLSVDPQWRGLRTDPRFVSLLARVSAR